MSRLFAAIENARALSLHGAAKGQSPDLPLMLLWQAVESRLADRRRKVIQIVPCAAREADPGVAVRFARLAGRAMGRAVVVLDAQRTGFEREDGEGGGWVAFGPLPGRSGDARELNPGLLRDAWRRLGERADLVVLDSPAVLDSPLGLALAPTVDGVILLIEAERTRPRVAEAARDALRGAGAHILGVVLNKRRYHVPKGIYERL
jgi:protein-tyrosine kinase